MLNLFFRLLPRPKAQFSLPARSTDGINGNPLGPICQNEGTIRQNQGPIRQNQGLWLWAIVQYPLPGLAPARKSISSSGLPGPKLHLVQLNVQSFLSGPGVGQEFSCALAGELA